MSTTTWVVDARLPLNVTASVPPGPRRLTKPLARLSPIGKLSVDVPVTGPGPAASQPFEVWAVTVRLPTTATAIGRTETCPLTANVAVPPVLSGPTKPSADRLSTTRPGVSGTNVAPDRPGTK